MHYMIALIPQAEAIPIYVQTAKRLFSACSHGYLLSEKSLPHITLCQFECSDEHEAQFIWNQVANKKPLPVQFTGVSFIKGKDEHKGFYWAELSVARDRELLEAHRHATSLAQSHSFPCLNEMGDLFRPHLTLSRIRLPLSIPTWPDALLNSESPFTLELHPCTLSTS